MKSRLFVFLAAVVVTTTLLGTQLTAQTTIYVVRHGEKLVTPGERNPALSKAGEARAKALARTLRSIEINACFSTQYKRTTLTVQPTAQVHGLKVKTYRAGQEAKFAKKLAKDFVGKRVLVSGHSNTVPAILKHLGVKTKLTLGDKDYDNLFVVSISKEGKVSLLHLHYGAKNPK